MDVRIRASYGGAEEDHLLRAVRWRPQPRGALARRSEGVFRRVARSDRPLSTSRRATARNLPHRRRSEAMISASLFPASTAGLHCGLRQVSTLQEALALFPASTAGLHCGGRLYGGGVATLASSSRPQRPGSIAARTSVAPSPTDDPSSRPQRPGSLRSCDGCRNAAGVRRETVTIYRSKAGHEAIHRWCGDVLDQALPSSHRQVGLSARSDPHDDSRHRSPGRRAAAWDEHERSDDDSPDRGSRTIA